MLEQNILIICCFETEHELQKVSNSQKLMKDQLDIIIVLSTFWYFTYLYLALWRTFQKTSRRWLQRLWEISTSTVLTTFPLCCSIDPFLSHLQLFLYIKATKTFSVKEKLSIYFPLWNVSYSLYFLLGCWEKERKTQCNVTCLFHRWDWQLGAHRYITIREAGSVGSSTLPSVSITYCFSISRTWQLFSPSLWKGRFLFRRLLTRGVSHQRHPGINN